MPETVIVHETITPKPKDAETVLVPFTCPWAQDGLQKALDGLNATSTGVLGYGVGSRHVKFKTPGDQMKAVEYWGRMVEIYCGTPINPVALGADQACRVIMRDE